MNKKLILLFIMLSISFSSHAIIIMHTLKARKEDYVIHFAATIDRWDEDDDTPNPCYHSSRQCLILSNHWHEADGKGESSGQYNDYIIYYAEVYKTVGELAAVFKKNHTLPYITSFQHSGHVINPECAGLYYQIDFGGDVNRLPNSICIPPPPIDLSCTTSGTTTIDYGTLPADYVTGSKREITINVTCNQDASLTAYVYGKGDGNIALRQDGSLEAEMTINDKKGDEGVKIDVKENIDHPLKITSTLIKHGNVTAGSFRGSSLIVFEYN